jgi:hypothetical protein
MKPITMYRELQLLNKKLVQQQVDLYAIGSPLYDKNKLRQAMLTYKASINLPTLMRQYNAKWAAERENKLSPVK